jgi:hypothetical protein
VIVVPSNLQPPTDSKPAPSNTTGVTDSTSSQIIAHNYTECCINYNVTTACMGFCNLKNILDGTTGQDPEQCEADFPSIVKCMAGMRQIFLTTYSETAVPHQFVISSFKFKIFLCLFWDRRYESRPLLH